MALVQTCVVLVKRSPFIDLDINNVGMYNIDRYELSLCKKYIPIRLLLIWPIVDRLLTENREHFRTLYFLVDRSHHYYSRKFNDVYNQLYHRALNPLIIFNVIIFFVSVFLKNEFLCIHFLTF